MFGVGPGRRYAHRVLAEGLHVSSSSRRTPYFIVGGLAVVAAVVAAVIISSGGSGGPLSAIGVNDPEAPAFDFEIADVSAITTTLVPNPEAHQPTQSQLKAAEKKAQEAAQPAATAAAAALDDFYTAAFLDPGNWQDGAYDDAFDGFSDEARAEAETQLEVLTAGTAAAGFTTIEPLPSTVKTRVLLDPHGAPTTVVGVAKFEATGEGADGSHIFISRGQFFFERIDGDWTVVGFSVSRADKAGKPLTSPSSPSGSES